MYNSTRNISSVNQPSFPIETAEAITAATKKRNSCFTYVKVEELNFTWSVNNYTICSKFVDSLKSSTFSTGDSSALKWSLKINTKTQNGHLSLFLCLDSVGTDKKQVLASFKLAILNKKMQEVIVKNKMCTFTEVASAGFDDFVSNTFLLNEANGLLSHDILNISCDLTLYFGLVNVTSQIDIPECETNKQNKQSELAELLENSKFSDVTLISCDGQEIKAHKTILSARSVVFSAMFDHDMEESNKGRVEIRDVKHNVLREMLRYIYAGETNFKKDLAEDLLAAADKYALKRLKMKCEEELCLGLSIENVVQISVLADRHSAGYLKSKAMEFMDINSSSAVGFMELMKSHPKLVAEVLRGRDAEESAAKRAKHSGNDL